MSAKLGSRKARLGLMRLGAPSSRPFLADLPSSLVLDDSGTELNLSSGHGLEMDGRAISATLDPRGSLASMEVRHTALEAPAATRGLEAADDERSLALDG